MADFDVNEWKSSLSSALPGGDGSISRSTSGTRVLVKVTVEWTDPTLDSPNNPQTLTVDSDMNPRHIQDKCHAGFPRKDSGFSLVELMIALVISLILTAGVIQVYLSSKSAYSTNQALASVQENGRFGLNFLTRDIRMADFWGCFKQQSNNVSNHVNNTNAPAGRDFDFNNALSGTDGASASNDYSDEITIKRADANGKPLFHRICPTPPRI